MSDHSRPSGSELEALFEASRQIERTLGQERAERLRLGTELGERLVRHQQDLAQAKQYTQQLLARDEKLRTLIGALQGRLQAAATENAQLKQAHARLSQSLQEQSQRQALDLTAARSSFEHVKARNLELEDELVKLRLEAARAREELDRAQAAVLEREHRYQTALLSQQERERNQLDATQAVRDQLKRTQDELAQFKSRWLEAERQRQESERLRKTAEQQLQGLHDRVEQLRGVEEAHRALEQRLRIEQAQRQQADLGVRSIRDEKELLRHELREVERRLTFTEAELNKSSAETGRLRAELHGAERPKPRERATAENERNPVSSLKTPQSPGRQAAAARLAELELLERMALPGYPVAGAAQD